MTSPPESYPEKHRDAAKSSRATEVFKRWFQTRFEKTNKNQASQPPDQLSTKADRPVDLRFNYQPQPAANIAKAGRSRMAAPQRAQVSVFFFCRQEVCGMSDEASQQTVAELVNGVRRSVCSLAPLFILRDSVREIPRLLKRAIRSRTRPAVDKRLQVQRKCAPCVFFR